MQKTMESSEHNFTYSKNVIVLTQEYYLKENSVMLSLDYN